MAKPIRVYWDSDCFLGIFNAEEDKIERCKKTIDEAHSGDLIIVYSVITLTEVIKMKGKTKLKREKEDDIREFFESDFLLPVNVDRYIASYARELIWQHEFLKPKDSIHVASASYHNIPKMNSFDSDILKLDQKIELRSGNNLLNICKPELPEQTELQLNDAKNKSKKE